MSFLGGKYPKDGADTKQAQSHGTKLIKDESLQFGRASDIGTAPPSRIYTRDYRKVDRDAESQDTVSAYLGNPLGL